jgi:hypothetical protein
MVCLSGHKDVKDAQDIGGLRVTVRLGSRAFSRHTQHAASQLTVARISVRDDGQAQLLALHTFEDICHHVVVK